MKKILYPIFISILLVVLIFVFFEELEGYFIDILNLSRERPVRFSLLSFLLLSSDIVLPVPSSVVMYYNGLVLGFVKGTSLSLLSLFISGSIGYWLGYFSAVGIKQEEDEKADELVKNFGGLAIITTRGIPILSESICFTAGYNRMNFKTFTLSNLMGALPISLVYAYFGSLGKDSEFFYYSFALSVLVSLVLYLAGKKLLAKEKRQRAS